MNTKHTPGPWSIETITDEMRKSDNLGAADFFNIKALDHMNLATVHGWKPEANARIISSAPEAIEYATKISAWVFAGEFQHKGMTYKVGVNDRTALKVLELLYINLISKVTGEGN
jgi:hypothetical protein